MEHQGADQPPPSLAALLEQSRSTDLPTLLQAKEQAKQLVRRDPSAAHIEALRRITTMLDELQATTAPAAQGRILKTVGEVLSYLHNDGRQCRKSKLYDDVKKGLLRKQDRSFLVTDVERYAASLPRTTTPDGRVAAAEDRQKRAEEADIRIKEARAAREEKRNAILDGQYVLRETVDQEHAARAVILNMGLKSRIEGAALDLVAAVGGDAKRSQVLVRELEALIDAASNEYAQPLEIEATLYGGDEERGEEDGDGNDDE